MNDFTDGLNSLTFIEIEKFNLRHYAKSWIRQEAHWMPGIYHRPRDGTSPWAKSQLPLCDLDRTVHAQVEVLSGRSQTLTSTA